MKQHLFCQFCYIPWLWYQMANFLNPLSPSSHIWERFSVAISHVIFRKFSWEFSLIFRLHEAIKMIPEFATISRPWDRRRHLTKGNKPALAECAIYSYWTVQTTSQSKFSYIHICNFSNTSIRLNAHQNREKTSRKPRNLAVFQTALTRQSIELPSKSLIKSLVRHRVKIPLASGFILRPTWKWPQTVHGRGQLQVFSKRAKYAVFDFEENFLGKNCGFCAQASIQHFTRSPNRTQLA